MGEAREFTNQGYKPVIPELDAGKNQGTPMFGCKKPWFQAKIFRRKAPKVSKYMIQIITAVCPYLTYL